MRSRLGRFSKRELRSLKIGTYIAAFEMRRHINKCKRRHGAKHRGAAASFYRKWAAARPDIDTVALDRYCHYNWGRRWRPGHYYRKRLYRRYAKLSARLCKDQPTSAQLSRRLQRATTVTAAAPARPGVAVPPRTTPTPPSRPAARRTAPEPSVVASPGPAL